MLRCPVHICLVTALAGAIAPAASAQEPTSAPRSPGDVLSRLVDEALSASPRVSASRAEADAYSARVPQAGAWDDPTLMLGFANLRTTSFDFGDDFMTMKMIQLSQRVPLPGQLGHRRDAAELRAAAARHRIEAVRVEVSSDVKVAYAELYYLERALDIVDRNLTILAGLEDITRTRYTTGSGTQPAMIRARLEIDGLRTQRVELLANRQAGLSTLNALLDRPASDPMEDAPFPASLAALAAEAREPLAFASALEMARTTGAPGRPAGLPRLDSLVSAALERKPELRAHVAGIAAQEETVALSRALRWPAPRFSVGYGQRDGFPDMLNASVSFDLPIFIGARQSSKVREETAVLARERAAHGTMVADIERAVTAAYAGVLDALAQLELYDRGILQRAEATLDATLSAYRTGAEDFLALLDSQTRLYTLELKRHRRLADLLIAWAALERAAGTEIRP